LRSLSILLAASFAALALAADGFARPQTTAPGGYLTVRVTLTDKGVTMSQTRARRGQTAIFLVANRAKTTRVFSLGDVSLKHHRGTGFAIKLGANQQKRVLLYLDYRGPLPSALGSTAKTKVVGVFWVT
jgi:hypothetical protein